MEVINVQIPDVRDGDIFSECNRLFLWEILNSQLQGMLKSLQEPIQ